MLYDIAFIQLGDLSQINVVTIWGILGVLKYPNFAEWQFLKGFTGSVTTDVTWDMHYKMVLGEIHPIGDSSTKSLAYFIA